MEQKCPQCGAPLPSGVLAGLCPACLFKQGVAADTGAGAGPEAAAFQPPTVEEMARLFPQLEIIALLGKGGMGAVYKARQAALDRLVALKILPPQTAGGPGFVERFNREARALARLNHPNIVAVYEFGQANGLPYFIMEFVDGLNLRELERAGKLSAREALQIVPQICEALQFAHDEGVVHRDIKPENILLDKKGRVKIADFGIAKILGTAAEADLTGTRHAIGTPHYMAPEQMEKPTTVDHRADIFSLGVVFYEMLTGELPLGKFAPPSSRKVEVDVRLDDVVLRALEKDPELRYQHVSQVKSAVDTIAGTAAPPPTGPTVNAEALAQEILARDYALSIRSCVGRAWRLMRKHFWPLVGVNALCWVLLAFVSSVGGATFGQESGRGSSSNVASLLSMIVSGPLMGGLSLYFLRKIRGEATSIEVAFSGFSHKFLHLFLAGFVTELLTGLGFVFLFLPGIYLVVAWWFTVPLVIDKGLDFWSAMELSRKVVTRHWWKLFGLMLVIMMLYALGLLMLIIGIFIMAPIAAIAAMYAYEDIFGGCGRSASAPAGIGPAGTVVMPPAVKAAAGGSGPWTLPTKIGLAVVVLVLGLLAVQFIRYNAPARNRSRAHHHVNAPSPDAGMQSSEANQTVGLAPPVPLAELAPPAKSVPAARFGQVITCELHAREAGTNQFLNLGTQQRLTPPPELASVMAGTTSDRNWKGLDISQDSRSFQYVSWLRENGVDLMYAGDGKIIAFDGVFAMAHGNSSTNWDDWAGLTPEQARAAVDTVDWARRVTVAQASGQPLPPAPAAGGAHRSAILLDSSEPGDPVVSLLTRDQAVNWYFETRSGKRGILQLAGFSADGSVATIRYKLLEQTGAREPADAVENAHRSRTLFADRLEAAANISNADQRDQALASLAYEAAMAGQASVVGSTLAKIINLDMRDASAHGAALMLSNNGLGKQALEIAKTIRNVEIRDQTMASLAQ